MYFRCNLKNLLEEKNMSINKLAIESGLSRTTLTDYKHDRVKFFNKNTLEKICEHLDCKINELLIFESGQPEYEI